jgi:ATP-binding cassette subfamily B (MDR/TAP) protein 1
MMKKSLYGLKKSPRMWYQKFDSYILGLGFTKRKFDQCVYFKLVVDNLVYVVLYVYGILLIKTTRKSSRT